MKSLAAAVAGLIAVGSVSASAQGLPPLKGGEAVYKGLCQDCHMSDARGAVGAAAYPALARNSKLETVGYPVAVVVHGQKAMPPFGAALNDEQIADVVNYVRTHFGNSFKDRATPADVKAAR